MCSNGYKAGTKQNKERLKATRRGVAIHNCDELSFVRWTENEQIFGPRDQTYEKQPSAVENLKQQFRWSDVAHVCSNCYRQRCHASDSGRAKLHAAENVPVPQQLVQNAVTEEAHGRTAVTRVTTSGPQARWHRLKTKQDRRAALSVTSSTHEHLNPAFWSDGRCRENAGIITRKLCSALSTALEASDRNQDLQ
jgi:hypothetical protein